MKETPDTVHGRLLESVHLSGYSFERACAEFEWLLEDDRWKRVGGGYDDIRKFIATLNLSALKGAVEQRKKIAARLKELDASQRAIGRLLGVTAMTINRDLNVTNVTSDENSPQQETAADVTNVTAWPLSDINPAGDAKRKFLRDQAVARKQNLKRLPRDGPFDTDQFRVRHGDCATATLSPQADWIITDPPYGLNAIPLYALLGCWAKENLKPGGSCLVMTGGLCLPEVLTELSRHLTYQWTLAWLMPGGQPTQIWPRKISCFWKPIIWLVNGPYQGEHIIRDVIQNAPNAREKDDHPWGQAEAGFAQLIETFTLPGDLICDPFCGGGTTGAAAIRLRRRFIGIDADAEAAETTRQRLAAIIKEEMCYEKSKSAI